jgi:WD40 repeat protein
MSNDGAWVVVGRADGHVLTFRANDGAVVQDWPAHKGMVNIVRITPDGALLVSGAADGTLRISRRRDAGGWEPAATLSAGGEVLGTVISPDASILVTTSRTASVKFWSLPTGKLLREIPLPKTPWKLAFSPDGNWLAVGAWDRSIQMWNTRSLATNIDAVRAEMSLLGHTQLVTGEAFDPTGRLLASVSNDGALRLWDVSGIEPSTGDIPAQNRRRCLITLDAHVGDAYTVAFIPGNSDPRDISVAVGYIDGTVRIWRLADFDQYIQGHVQYQKQTRKSLPGSHSAD